MPRLLVLNPNTTGSITELAARHVRAALGEDFEIVTATAEFGCAHIASEACFAIAEHAALESFAERGEGCDAVLLACFGDPGLFALREVSRVPVVGLAEASMRAAAERGGRFAIVTTGGERWKPMLERFAAALGLRERLAAVRTVALGGGEIAEDQEAAVALLTSACAAAAEEDGSDEVILGGAGLAGLAERIQPRVWVPVFDSVVVGAQRAAALCRARQDGEGVSSGVSAALGRLLA
jgi:Asp/Glu/hydantoin racemase